MTSLLERPPLPPSPLFFLSRSEIPLSCRSRMSCFSSLLFAHPLTLYLPKNIKVALRASVLGRLGLTHDLRSLRRVWSSCDKAAKGRRSSPPFTFPIHLSTPSTAFCLHPRGFGWFADDSHALHFLRFVLLLFSDGRLLRPIPCFPSMHHCLILLLFCILSSR